MIIDLSSIIKDYDGSMDLDIKSDLENTDFLGEEYKFVDGLNIKGKITNNTKSLFLKAKVTGKMLVHCARCLKEICEDVDFDISEILVKDDSTESPVDDDVVVFSGNELDIDDIVINNFLMNISAKFLCSEDCKGLCPKCGQDLNIAECSCSDDEIDSRWAELAKIMKNSDTE